MTYDIIFVSGEMYFDHPLCGIAILKRLLEKKGYSVGVIEQPTKEEDIKKLGKPRLFFGITSGSIDSMVRNYTPLKKKRSEDKNLDYDENVPDRAVIVYSNWVKKNFKDSTIVLGGVESSLRRFTHYDYWDNKVRRSILFDSRADILVYGYSEKQIVQIAENIKENKSLENIKGTCVISKEVPNNFLIMPSHKEASESKEKFIEMQNSFDVDKNIAQLVDTRYILQYKAPNYNSKDLDEYYSLPFTREVPKELRGFQFSVVIHRGCIGNCNFCSLRLTSGEKIVSRSEKSIIDEIKKITRHRYFKGNIDDLSAPSVNMYGLDCSARDKCKKKCLECIKTEKNPRFLNLLRNLRKIKNVKNVFIRSGIRYDMVDNETLKEIVRFHTPDTLRIAPEHVNRNVLKLMNKDKGNLDEFIKRFNSFSKGKKGLSFYFMSAHPGSGIKEAKELKEKINMLKNAESVQTFTPTPMSISTCMYHTGINPKTKKKVYVPYTYKEKKVQKRILFDEKTKGR